MISVQVVEDSSRRLVLRSPVTRACEGVMVLVGLGWASDHRGAHHLRRRSTGGAGIGPARG
jgi:hypothetical protein